MRSSAAIGSPSFDTEARVVALERALGTIARPHERPCNTLEEAARECRFAIAIELLWRDPTLDREMILRRLQVLTERQDVDLRRADVVHRFDELGLGLAESEHETRLGQHGRAVMLRVREHRERFLITRALIANRLREPAHGLDILCEHFEATVDDG